MVLVTATLLIALTGAMDGAVLTDIPRFLPEVTSSEVRERSERRAVVEQEAVSRMMMFSKKVHLMLEITEEGHEIRFAIGAAG